MAATLPSLQSVADTMATFFTTLLLAGLGGVALAAILHWTSVSSTIWDGLAEWGLPLAAIVSVGATAGSLYFSEGANFVPCEFCWYQRIAMYPLALILGIAAVRRDRGIRIYAIPTAAIGAALALYHYLVQQFPDLETGTCSATVPCSAKWVERFGFVSIPYMALSAFLAIMVLLAVWTLH